MDRYLRLVGDEEGPLVGPGGAGCRVVKVEIPASPAPGDDGVLAVLAVAREELQAMGGRLDVDGDLGR